MTDQIKQLPQEIQDKLDTYLTRIKAVKWFQHSADLKREEVEQKVNVVLEGFGVKAKITYSLLKTEKDWGAARGAAWDAAWGAAWDAAWGAARGAAWGAAWDAAWDAAWGGAARGAAWGAAWDAARMDAAWDAARGGAEIIASDLKDYSKKYPKGSFINLIPLYEMGLWPIGVVGGKFIVGVPHYNQDFPKDLQDNI